MTTPAMTTPMTTPYLPTAGAAPDPQWPHTYAAQVAVVTDPLNQGRIRMIVPQVLGTAFSNWAMPMQPGIVPAVGTTCLAVFLGGNVNAPYYFIGVTAALVEAISGSETTLNTNPSFAGSVLTGWTATNGTLTATTPNVDTNPPVLTAALLTASGSGGGYIQETAAPFTAVIGQPYQLQAWVYYPLGGNVSLGFGWTGQADTLTTATAAAGTWTLLNTVQTATATTGYPKIGPTTSTTGQQFTATSISVTGQIPGQLISSGSISQSQVNFTARNIGGITTSIAASAPSGALAGDLWFDSAAGYQLYQYNGTSWNLYQFGTGAIAAGSITAALIAAGTITATQIAAGTITAANIATGTITATQIAASTITAAKIATGTITATQISTSAGITGSQIAGTTITGSNIATGTVTATQIASGTITATQISSSAAITGGQIASTTITGGNIATGTITATNITSGTITATQIAAGTITATKLVSGITVSGIVDATTITGANIVAQGTAGEFLVYSGTAAAGNLVASVSASGGTDGFGNIYRQGFVSYNNSAGNATQLQPSELLFLTGSLSSGWTQQSWNVIGTTLNNGWVGAITVQVLPIGQGIVALDFGGTPGTVADGTVIWTFGATYTPNTFKQLPMTTDVEKNNATFSTYSESCYLYIGASGQVQVYGVQSNATFMRGSAMYALGF